MDDIGLDDLNIANKMPISGWVGYIRFASIETMTSGMINPNITSQNCRISIHCSFGCCCRCSSNRQTVQNRKLKKVNNPRKKSTITIVRVIREITTWSQSQTELTIKRRRYTPSCHFNGSVSEKPNRFRSVVFTALSHLRYRIQIPYLNNLGSG